MNIGAYCRLLMRAGRGGGLATAKVRTMFDIDYDALRRDDITLLIFDVDDTMTGYHDVIRQDVLSLLQKLAQQFDLAVISNCSMERREYLRTVFQGLPLVLGDSSDKPSMAPFKEMLARCAVAPAQAAMIGDRAGMDLFGAYDSGITVRVLIEPYSAHRDGLVAPAWYRLIRGVENWVFA